MKQVLQNLRSGDLEVVDVPCPRVAAGHLLVQTSASLISAGTERSLVEFSKASLIQKARQQPDRVKQVLDKIKSDGLMPTLEAVFARLDQPLPLGYCNAGRVLEVGEGVRGYEVGQRVVSNGSHAEIVHVPKNLCAPIPDAVPDHHAAFTVLASIGLQGVRLTQPTLGESVVVYGLGLVGLLTVQLLVASGARVCGIDLDPGRLELAERFGAFPVNASDTDPVAAAKRFSGVDGVDAVLITASAKNDAIVHQSAEMSRKRGRIVLVGVVNLDLKRADFYEKELSFQVSCSYGPGRYDAVYEQGGHDYPLPYVRWTEGRNLQAILESMASKRLDVEPLVSSRIPHAEASRAYELLTTDKSQLGIVLDYPYESVDLKREVNAEPSVKTQGTGQASIALIGAGGFAQRVLLPEIQRAGGRLVGVASAGGVNATHAARKFGAAHCFSDYHDVLAREDINTVFITTRHHQHAPMIVSALEAGKHVFVEKPIAIDQRGLDDVRRAFESAKDCLLTVGFNRRFSPHAVKMRELLSNRVGPVCATVLINAGQIPPDHWSQDPVVGGGRILGEGCHWIDLLRYLIGSSIRRVTTSMIGKNTSSPTRNDHVVIALEFADGSLGTLQYFSNGPKDFPKERMDVFCDNRALHLNNFRTLIGYGYSGFRHLKLWRQNKGHRTEVHTFLERVESGGVLPIPADELWNVSQATLAAQESTDSGQPVEVL